MENEKDVISTEEACNLLGITRQTLYKLAEKGEIPSKKIGSKHKFIKSSIMDYLQHKEPNNPKEYKEWELKGDFATVGIKKMAKRTFQELASNIEELIVNAYDADATTVQIILDYDKNALNIIDDGNGMDEEILSSYVIYGESEKSSVSKSPKFSRAPIGEYGMGGKLAITNICKICKIITKKDGKEHIFNMNRAELDKARLVSAIRNKVITRSCSEDMHGTAIYMEQLNSKTIDSDRLIERFESKMPKSQNFKIIMSIIKGGDKKDIEIKEPVFVYDEKFEFEDSLKLIGKVKLSIYFTKEPIPATKQGIWTRVNGRIVNEKAEWFDLFKLTSGNRYRYRLYGYGEADGLKDFVTFAKNDFVDCPEYREYLNFGHKSISDVQNKLLKRDENVKKEQDRTLVKRVEKEVNDIVSKLDDPLTLGSLEAKIKKEYTKEIENAPDNPFPTLDKVEEEAKKVASAVRRGKDKRSRRNQSLTDSEKMTYSGKNYNIVTVDMSETGDLVKFSKQGNLIEINEKHSFYISASKGDYLNSLVRDIAFTEIANDYGEGNMITFDRVFNELARIASQMPI
jgi:excisionase family DNA binding protein